MKPGDARLCLERGKNHFLPACTHQEMSLCSVTSLSGEIRSPLPTKTKKSKHIWMYVSPLLKMVTNLFLSEQGSDVSSEAFRSISSTLPRRSRSLTGNTNNRQQNELHCITRGILFFCFIIAGRHVEHDQGQRGQTNSCKKPLLPRCAVAWPVVIVTEGLRSEPCHVAHVRRNGLMKESFALKHKVK